MKRLRLVPFLALSALLVLLIPSFARAQHPGSITTFAGVEVPGTEGDGGPATSARLYFPSGLSIDDVGNVYISDLQRSKVRKVSIDGTIATVAGTGSCCFPNGNDGPAKDAVVGPTRMTVDKDGNLFLSELDFNVIRKISPDGIIHWIAGTGVPGYLGDGGPATNARLNEPLGIVLDLQGNLYIADRTNHVIRKVTSGGTISTFSQLPFEAISTDLEFDPGGSLYALWQRTQGTITSNLIYKIGPNGERVYYLGPSCIDGDCPTIQVDIGAAIFPYQRASFAFDGQGTPFFAAAGVKKYDTATGTLVTVAGAGGAGSYEGDGFPATSRHINSSEIAIDPNGNVLIVDTDNSRVFKVWGVAAPAAHRFTVTPSAVGLRAGDPLTVTVAANGPVAAAPAVAISGPCIDRTVISMTPTAEANTFAGTYAVPVGASSCTATIEAHGKDPSGNPYRGGAALVQLDQLPPSTVIIVSGLLAANGWFEGPAGVTLTSTDPDPSSGAVTTYYGLDAPACSPAARENCLIYTEPFIVSDDGEHALTAFSVDPAGNVSPVQTQTFKTNPTGPAAADASITLDEDTSVAVTLSATDVAGDPLVYSVVAPPTHGTLTGTGPALAYTPNPDFNGADSFTFRANDGNHDSNTATVALTVTPVNDAPLAADLSLTGFRDRALPLRLVGTDVDHDPLSYAVVTSPAHGTLTGTAPALTYTSAPGYAGTDGLTYTISDGNATSAPATVGLTLLAPVLLLGEGDGQFTVQPGQSQTLLISTTAATTNVAGVELRLGVSAPAGAPPLTPVFAPTDTTADWQYVADPNDPWHVVVASTHNLSGAHDLLRLTLKADPLTPLGTVYRLDPQAALFTDERAVETDVKSLTAGSYVTVAHCEERAKGDVTGDGSVDIADAVEVLRIIVGLSVPANDCAAAAADTNCDGEVKVGDAILILRHIVFEEAFPACG